MENAGFGTLDSHFPDSWIGVLFNDSVADPHGRDAAAALLHDIHSGLLPS